MLRRQKTLARLHEELSVLDLFDRVHQDATDADPAENRAYALRQTRRSQIMDEIREVSASKLKYRNHTRITSATLLLGTIGYAALLYLLK